MIITLTRELLEKVRVGQSICFHVRDFSSKQASEKALRRDNRSRLASTLMAPSNKKTRTRDIRKRFRRYKAHHNLMVITYGGLSPGKDYHIRVAGANSVGQVWVDISEEKCE